MLALSSLLAICKELGSFTAVCSSEMSPALNKFPAHANSRQKNTQAVLYHFEAWAKFLTFLIRKLDKITRILHCIECLSYWIVKAGDAFVSGVTNDSELELYRPQSRNAVARNSLLSNTDCSLILSHPPQGAFWPERVLCMIATPSQLLESIIETEHRGPRRPEFFSKAKYKAKAKETHLLALITWQALHSVMYLCGYQVFA